MVAGCMGGGIGFNIDFETMTSFPITLNYQGTFMESCMKDDEVLFTKSDFDRIRNRHTGVEMSVQSESLTVTYSDGSVSAVCNGNEVSMELYSLEGKLIARTRNNDRASLETSTLPSGIYIAKAALRRDLCGSQDRTVTRLFACAHSPRRKAPGGNHTETDNHILHGTWTVHN